ncbi:MULTISPECIES: TPM domain-containing protein [unclassified Rubrivivax]|uniref:TPM domain-containing protein n=1 Tax=unclassified Rubrivivax TaxID=2649762 RepID=UPI0013E998AD|nr:MULTISPECIES: TPM domain-containing protein [unclassified Rubrivivax]MCC9596908.1 TPM domain-containing protein [Rubrivivax sp. JA1055]MCC9649064.1 TPM domain-containing protein [Rubrivivax sp. JA1029]MCD0422814.1 TPM domain-containing protein [Rubrivivax sp. JA1024]
MGLGRALRHLFADHGDVRRVLDDAAMARLAERVRASEARHSGEIRLCVEAGLPWGWLQRPVRERALEVFAELGVWDTEANNGVLIYLLLADHAIELVADRGVMRHAPAGHWDGVVATMREAFRAGRFEDGLAQAVDAVDALLVRHYPLAEGEANPNELPDAPHVR